jgi:hypothetical protein
MTDYLRRLKAKLGETHLPHPVPKVPKAISAPTGVGFGTFGTDLGTRIFRTEDPRALSVCLQCNAPGADPATGLHLECARYRARSVPSGPVCDRCKETTFIWTGRRVVDCPACNPFSERWRG